MIALKDPVARTSLRNRGFPVARAMRETNTVARPSWQASTLAGKRDIDQASRLPPPIVFRRYQLRAYRHSERGYQCRYRRLVRTSAVEKHIRQMEAVEIFVAADNLSILEI